MSHLCIIGTHLLLQCITVSIMYYREFLCIIVSHFCITVSHLCISVYHLCTTVSHSCITVSHLPDWHGGLIRWLSSMLTNALYVRSQPGTDNFVLSVCCRMRFLVCNVTSITHIRTGELTVIIPTQLLYGSIYHHCASFIYHCESFMCSSNLLHAAWTIKLLYSLAQN